MRGKLITFEGGEGTGKSTQVRLLADFLRTKGISVTTTREPGGTQGAELVRSLLVSGPTNRWDPLCEVLLLNAARLDHWQKVIFPTLQRGKWVICDRFIDSTIAYQGYAQGVQLSFIKNLHDELLSSHLPDLTFILDLDPTIGIHRSLQRHTSETRFENIHLDFHHQVRQGYLDIAQKDPVRCRVITTSRSICEIHQVVISEIKTLLDLEEKSPKGKGVDDSRHY